MASSVLLPNIATLSAYGPTSQGPAGVLPQNMYWNNALTSVNPQLTQQLAYNSAYPNGAYSQTSQTQIMGVQNSSFNAWYSGVAGSVDAGANELNAKLAALGASANPYQALVTAFSQLSDANRSAIITGANQNNVRAVNIMKSVGDASAYIISSGGALGSILPGTVTPTDEMSVKRQSMLMATKHFNDEHAALLATLPATDALREHKATEGALRKLNQTEADLIMDGKAGNIPQALEVAGKLSAMVAALYPTATNLGNWPASRAPVAITPSTTTTVPTTADLQPIFSALQSTFTTASAQSGVTRERAIATAWASLTEPQRAALQSSATTDTTSQGIIREVWLAALSIGSLPSPGTAQTQPAGLYNGYSNPNYNYNYNYAGNTYAPNSYASMYPNTAAPQYYA